MHLAKIIFDSLATKMFLNYFYDYLAYMHHFRANFSATNGTWGGYHIIKKLMKNGTWCSQEKAILKKCWNMLNFSSWSDCRRGIVEIVSAWNGCHFLHLLDIFDLENTLFYYIKRSIYSFLSFLWAFQGLPTNPFRNLVT